MYSTTSNHAVDKMKRDFETLIGWEILLYIVRNNTVSDSTTLVISEGQFREFNV